MRKFVVEGQVYSLGYHNGFAYVIVESYEHDDSIAPTMLEVGGTVKEYLNELYDTDYEEKYMRKRFTFTNWCTLVRVEVLNRAGHVVKKVEQDSDFWSWIDNPDIVPQEQEISS